MKTFNIEVQRVNAMSNGNGLVNAQIDALAIPSSTVDGKAPATWLSVSEDAARVLLQLLKAQLSEVDKRNGRSQS